MSATNEKDHAREQAKAQLASIVEMVEVLKKAEEAENEDAVDAAREAIQQDALDVSVRSGWASVGDDMNPEEFTILLCTGGPAVRLHGELNEYCEPSRAWIEYQDWGTPWTGLIVPAGKEHDAMLRYAQEFYFGG